MERAVTDPIERLSTTVGYLVALLLLAALLIGAGTLLYLLVEWAVRQVA